MASRLYPGFGSGKGVYTASFTAKAIAARDDLECGDKIILPQASFKEISRQKLPFPLHFQLSGTTAPASSNRAEQYAGVYEFSAPSNTVLLPAWMMQNLGLKSGATIKISTVRDILPGTLVKFQPHSQEFVDLAASLGPKELLEACMRSYSVLSVGERIVVDVMDKRFPLTVEAVSPGSRISLYGTVDLEVEFGEVLEGGEPTVTAAALPGRVSPAGPAPIKQGKAAAPGATLIKGTSRKALAVSGLGTAAAATSSPGRAASAGSAGMSGQAGNVKQQVTVQPRVGMARKPAAAPTASSKVAAAVAKPTMRTAASSGGLAASRAPNAAPTKAARTSSADELPAAASEVTPSTSTHRAAVQAEPVTPSIRFGGEDGDAGSLAAGPPHAMPAAAAPPSLVSREPASTAALALLFNGNSDTTAPVIPDRRVAAEQRARAALARLTVAAEQDPASVTARAVVPLLPASSTTALVRRALLEQDPDADEGELPAASAWQGHTVVSAAAEVPAGVATATSTASPVFGPAVTAAAHIHEGARRSGNAGLAASLVSALRVQPDLKSGTEISADEAVCLHCSGAVPKHNIQMHVAMCKRNIAYHKVPCPTCHETVIRKTLESQQHAHCELCTELLPSFEPAYETADDAKASHATACPQRRLACECGLETVAAELESHRKACDAARDACEFCSLRFKCAALEQHKAACGSRTAECDVCHSLVQRAKLRAHTVEAHGAV